jgi:hypothetical protein
MLIYIFEKSPQAIKNHSRRIDHPISTNIGKLALPLSGSLNSYGGYSKRPLFLYINKLCFNGIYHGCYSGIFSLENTTYIDSLSCI